MRDPIRVGLVHWSMPPTTGGVESHVADLAAALSELGCDVTVVTGEPAPHQIEGVKVHSEPLLDLARLREGHQAPGELAAALRGSLGEVIAACGLQVVHGHNLHHFFAEPATVLDVLRNELGFLLHHTFHETWPDILHRRPLYRGWDANYAVSRFIQDECVDRLGFCPALRPLGVDTTRFRARGIPRMSSNGPVILHPARILPWKGVHLSVEMLARLRTRGIAARLVLTDTQRIVDWNEELVRYRADVHALMERLGVTDAVELRTVRYSDMPALYDQADIVIYPTVGDEPFGLVPLEAMSMERPVVASRSGGMNETVLDGQTGYLTEPGDAEGLTARVESLWRNPEVARKMGRAGRRHVLAHYDGRTYAASLLAEYRGGLARKQVDTFASAPG